MCHKWEKRVDIGSSKNLPRLIKKQELVKDFSALLLLAFGVLCWGGGRGCLVYCRMFNSIPGFYLLEARSTPPAVWQPKMSTDIDR